MINGFTSAEHEFQSKVVRVRNESVVILVGLTQILVLTLGIGIGVQFGKELINNIFV
jgi:hypothetical protein